MSAGSILGRKNNFGFLRLFFAALVILAHSPELIDGNRSREILTILFNTMSFGEVAVDGFFLVSGYLITKSYFSQPDVKMYMAKRILRIYPAYLVCFWLCVLILGPIVSNQTLGSFPLIIAKNVYKNIFLLQPDVPGAFGQLHYPALNGAMWTISYEFRCYLSVVVIGVVAMRIGLPARKGRWLLLAAVATGLLLNGMGVFHGSSSGLKAFVGTASNNVRLFPVFGVGALFFLFREEIPFRKIYAVAAAIFLVACMSNKYAAEAGFAIFGGYLTFFFAFHVRMLSISSLDNKNDVSYGLYLYAWPVQNLFIWLYPGINPWLLCLITLVLASGAGYLSWNLVEKPANGLVRRPRLSSV